jgi:hypothetical protein
VFGNEVEIMLLKKLFFLFKIIFFIFSYCFDVLILEVIF